MIEKQIWDFIHHFKTNLTMAERESSRLVVTGSDNFYMCAFPTYKRIMQFKVESNYKLTTSSVEYIISQVRIDGIEFPGLNNIEQDKINELLYNKLIPYIRELKLDSLGI